jgi:hypothetical protein
MMGHRLTLFAHTYALVCLSREIDIESDDEVLYQSKRSSQKKPDQHLSLPDLSDGLPTTTTTTTTSTTTNQVSHHSIQSSSTELSSSSNIHDTKLNRMSHRHRSIDNCLTYSHVFRCCLNRHSTNNINKWQSILTKCNTEKSKKSGKTHTHMTQDDFFFASVLFK